MWFSHKPQRCCYFLKAAKLKERKHEKLIFSLGIKSLEKVGKIFSFLFKKKSVFSLLIFAANPWRWAVLSEAKKFSHKNRKSISGNVHDFSHVPSTLRGFFFGREWEREIRIEKIRINNEYFSLRILSSGPANSSARIKKVTPFLAPLNWINSPNKVVEFVISASTGLSDSIVGRARCEKTAISITIHSWDLLFDSMGFLLHEEFRSRSLSRQARLAALKATSSRTFDKDILICFKIQLHEHRRVHHHRILVQTTLVEQQQKTEIEATRHLQIENYNARQHDKVTKSHFSSHRDFIPLPTHIGSWLRNHCSTRSFDNKNSRSEWKPHYSIHPGSLSFPVLLFVDFDLLSITVYDSYGSRREKNYRKFNSNSSETWFGCCSTRDMKELLGTREEN